MDREEIIEKINTELKNESPVFLDFILRFIISLKKKV